MCSIFFWLLASLTCFSQNHRSDIKISFIKTNDSIKSSNLYFNVLKIYNNSANAISGNITFNAPENWKLITFPVEQTIIQAGDSAEIPVRLSPSFDAAGGISYILSANFRTSERLISTNTYLTIPSIKRWEMSTEKSSIFFTEDNPNANFQVKLTNKGNTNELIKLKYQLGKLLEFSTNISDDYVEFLNLPAFKDTIISKSVHYKKNLSYDEKVRYENNWKESIIKLTASNEYYTKNYTITTRKLKSTFTNQRAQNLSPLNFDYQLYNLMSDQPIRNNFKIYGDVLFPRNAEIQYVAGLQNFSFDNSIIDVSHQLLYSLIYSDKHNNILVGNNVSSGDLHSINGRGIVGSLKLDSKNKISYAITQNPYNHSLGEDLAFSTSLNNISLNTEFTHESDVANTYSASSALIGAGFTLFKHFSFGFHLLGSQSNYDLINGKDTSVLGYSYRLFYGVKYKKFDLRFNAMNSVHNYIRNSGLEQYYLDSKLQLNNHTNLNLYGNRFYYSTTRYPYNFTNPASFNSTDYVQLALSTSSGNLMYQLGPNYSGSMRQFYNSNNGYKSEYQTYQPGIWSSVSIKLNGYRSISPNLTISNLRFYYKSQDPDLQNYSSDKNIYYSVGLNYFDNVWRVNAYYSSGSASDLYRSVMIDTQPVVSKSIQVRPAYENFFFNRTVKLSAYVNYAYYMPSGRENVSYNLKYDQFLKGGWVLSLSGFMYSNSSTDQQSGRVETRDLNFIIGCTKSFNIQQPRLKYYNFKTVFFNDLDGNGIKSANEPPVSNVLVSIEKDRNVGSGQSNIAETQLLSDVNGVIDFENLPQDNYRLSFIPMVNLQSLYFLNGSEQPYNNDKDRTLYVPLVESYKIKGKIVLIRDPNSSEGKIELGGIRIMATSEKGETYSALTDNFGAFLLSVPKADKFKVHINNVFGQQFNIDTNETEIQFTENKTISLDFTFIEKRREVQFENGTELFKFSSLSAPSEAVTPNNTKLKIEKKNEPANSISYSIQLGMLKSYRNPQYFQIKYKLKDEVLYSDNGGVFKYFSGEFSSKLEAKKRISELGAKGLFIVPIDRSLLKKAVQITTEKPKEKIENTDKSGTYSIQLDALKTYRDPAYYVSKYNLKTEVYFTQKNGEFKYYTGEYSSMIEAKSAIKTLAINGFVVAVDRSELKKALPTTVFKPKPDAEQIQKSTKEKSPFQNSLIYSIQLDVVRNFVNPNDYKEKFNLKMDVYYIEKDSMYYYYTGNYESIEAAKADISRYGLSGYIKQVDRTLFKKGK